MYLQEQVYGQYDRLRPDYIPLDSTNIKQDNTFNLFGCLNLDELFYKSQGTVINTLDDTSSSITDHLVTKLVQSRDGELGFTPKCDCGKYASRKYEGQMCPKCHSIVRTEFVDKVSHEYWIEIPENCPPMIHPMWYWQLENITGINKGKGGGNLAKYLFCTKNEASSKIPVNLSHVILEKSPKWFYENHEQVFDYLFSPNFKVSSKKAKTKLAWLKLFYTEYKDIMFTRHYPILHASLHPLIGQFKSHYKKGDKTMKNIFKAVTDMMITSFTLTKGIQKRNTVDGKLLNVLDSLMTYYGDIITTKLNKKRGILRQHNLGSRCHFTYRGVCTPIQGPHKVDELILPWRILVGSMKHELINLLVNREKMGVNEALGKIFNALIDERECDPLIHRCLETLRDESPWKGIPVLLGRNPTLRHGSIMLFFVTEIPTNPIGSSVEISPLVIRNMNADFKKGI